MGERLRVDRGDGRLFNVSESDLPAFKRDNPGAKVVPKPAPSTSPSEREEAATAAAARRTVPPPPAEVPATTLVSFPTPGAASGAPAPQAEKRRVLSDLTLPELQELARVHGVAVAEGTKKAEVFKALKAASVSPETPAPAV